MAKRRKNQLRIRITRERIEALHGVCEDMITLFKPENMHEQLAYAYLYELYTTLTEKMRLYQSVYTLHMSMMEAMSFKQLWNVIDMQHNKYACILIRNILNKIDHAQQSLLEM
jgi:hypothetical protein